MKPSFFALFGLAALSACGQEDGRYNVVESLAQEQRKYELTTGDAYYGRMLPGNGDFLTGPSVTIHERLVDGTLQRSVAIHNSAGHIQIKGFDDNGDGIWDRIHNRRYCCPLKDIQLSSSLEKIELQAITGELDRAVKDVRQSRNRQGWESGPGDEF